MQAIKRYKNIWVIPVVTLLFISCLDGKMKQSKEEGMADKVMESQNKHEQKYKKKTEAESVIDSSLAEKDSTRLQLVGKSLLH